MDTSTRRRGRPPLPTPFHLPAGITGFDLLRLTHLKRLRDETLFKEKTGISVRQYGMLLLLEENGGANAGQLARVLSITPQSIAPLLFELELNGLIVKDTERRRGARVELNITKLGRRKLTQGHRVIRQTEAELCQSLSASEAANFRRIVVRIADFYAELTKGKPTPERSRIILGADAEMGMR